MDIYIVERKREDVGYDEFDSHMVVANNKKEARSVASKGCANEGEQCWTSNECEVKKISSYDGKETKAKIIHSSYNAG
jgi:hypothetical protein